MRDNRYDRYNSERLLRRIEALFRLLGVGLIVAGVAVYIFTAPPIGGLHWDRQELAVASMLVLFGIIIQAAIALSRRER